MKKVVYLLMGGIFGIDRFVDSGGMYGLKDILVKNGVVVNVYGWDQYQETEQHIMATRWDAGDKCILVGYSGGGSRATYVARDMPGKDFDLIVGYDPSPARQVLPFGNNVRKAVCFHNKDTSMTIPFIGTLGGGEYTCPARPGIVTTIEIDENHMLVQEDQSLHDYTAMAIAAL